MYKIKLFLLIGLLFCYGINVSAYNFTFFNMTGKKARVTVHLTFGSPTTKAIDSYQEYTFIFKGLKIGLCLEKIMVSIKDGTKWSTPRKAKIEILASEDRFKHLLASGSLFGVIARDYALLISASLCRGRSFILSIDPKSQDVYAITGLDV